MISDLTSARSKNGAIRAKMSPNASFQPISSVVRSRRRRVSPGGFIRCTVQVTTPRISARGERLRFIGAHHASTGKFLRYFSARCASKNGSGSTHLAFGSLSWRSSSSPSPPDAALTQAVGSAGKGSNFFALSLRKSPIKGNFRSLFPGTAIPLTVLSDYWPVVIRAFECKLGGDPRNKGIRVCKQRFEGELRSLFVAVRRQAQQSLGGLQICRIGAPHV